MTTEANADSEPGQPLGLPLNDGLGAGADARRWLLAYVLEFDDDGEPEGAILHRGTEEECERLASMLPAVAYNGPRNVLRASMRWAPEAPNA